MKYPLFLLICIFSTQAFALKYMCSKAVRGNSGKYKTIKNNFEYAKSNGNFATQKNNFVSQVESAINAIKTAGCPMQDPEVNKIVSPLNELKATIENTKGQKVQATKSTPVPIVTTKVRPSTTASPVKNTEKLPYSCRQVIKRQSGKPKIFAQEIAYYESAISKSVSVNIVNGLGFAEKIKSSLNDIESGACPLKHPKVIAVSSVLKAQLAKIPDLTKKLQAINSSQSQKADVSNYPGFEKDLSFIVYLNDKYQDPSKYYDTNIKADWRKINASGKDRLSFMGVNVKKPFYDFESTKDIYKNIFSDSNKYNNLIKEIEKKYSELFKTNKKIAQKYVSARDNAQKKISSILSEHYKWITTTFPKLIKINNKVINLTINESLKSKRSSGLRKVIIPDSLKANKQMIEVLSYLHKDQSKVTTLKSEQNELKIKFQSATKKLAAVILKEARLPKEQYNGADKEKIRTAFLEAGKNKLKGKEVLKIVMVNKDWNITNYVTWSNSTAYHHHYSDLGVRCILKENDKVAKMITAWYRVNHKKENKVSIWFEESRDKDIYQDPKILIENMN